MKHYTLSLVLLLLSAPYTTFSASYERLLPAEEDDNDQRAMQTVARCISILKPHYCPVQAYYCPFHYVRITPNASAVYLFYGYLATQDPKINLEDERQRLETFLRDAIFFNKEEAKQGIDKHLQKQYKRHKSIVKAHVVDHDIKMKEGKITANVMDRESTHSLITPLYMKEFIQEARPTIKQTTVEQKPQALLRALQERQSSMQPIKQPYRSIIVMLNLQQLKQEVREQKLLMDAQVSLDL